MKNRSMPIDDKLSLREIGWLCLALLVAVGLLLVFIPNIPRAWPPIPRDASAFTAFWLLIEDMGWVFFYGLIVIWLSEALPRAWRALRRRLVGLIS